MTWPSSNVPEATRLESARRFRSVLFRALNNGQKSKIEAKQNHRLPCSGVVTLAERDTLAESRRDQVVVRFYPIGEGMRTRLRTVGATLSGRGSG